jgi:hypothetical protein
VLITVIQLRDRAWPAIRRAYHPCAVVDHHTAASRSFFTSGIST